VDHLLARVRVVSVLRSPGSWAVAYVLLADTAYTSDELAVRYEATVHVTAVNERL